jgi:hypothetical protein
MVVTRLPFTAGSSLMEAVVAIPTARRPELLALTLERLAAASGRLEVHIYADSVTESRLTEIEAARDEFLPGAFLFHAASHVSVPSGCWNILNAIKSASRCSENVYLVEEDVLVYPQFFSWHESQTAVASCGRRHPDLRWKYRETYTNPGACLRRPLLDALIPHINDEYFADTKSYCEKHFTPWDVSTLDDWLIRRVMRENDWLPAYPDVPVCAHQGFRNYNMLDIYQNKEGDLSHRISRAREILSTVKSTDRYARDFEPYQP